MRLESNISEKIKNMLDSDNIGKYDKIKRILNILSEDTDEGMLSADSLEQRANRISEWIQKRKDDGDEPYKCVFYYTVYKQSDLHILDEPAISKITDILKKYNVEYSFCDTIDGDYNLNRDWIETRTPIDCFVEFCGVYPVKWDTHDTALIDAMVDRGDIFISVFWLKDGEYIPNH